MSLFLFFKTWASLWSVLLAVVGQVSLPLDPWATYLGTSVIVSRRAKSWPSRQLACVSVVGTVDWVSG